MSDLRSPPSSSVPTFQIVPVPSIAPGSQPCSTANANANLAASMSLLNPKASTIWSIVALATIGQSNRLLVFRHHTLLLTMLCSSECRDVTRVMRYSFRNEP